jgi:hypothetical protein
VLKPTESLLSRNQWWLECMLNSLPTALVSDIQETAMQASRFIASL